MNGMRKMIAAIAGKTDDDGLKVPDRQISRSAGLRAPAPPALRPLAPNPRRAEQWARNTSRVAVVQLPAPPPDAAPGATATDVVSWVQHAATDKVDLVLFPEYHLGNTHLSKSANGVYRSPPVAAVAAAARAAGIYVAVGAWVLWAEDTFCCPPPPKQYTNTILLFGRSGVLEGVYNKTHPAVGGPPFFWPPKDVQGGEWAMFWGDDYPVFDLDFARIGPRAPPDPGFAFLLARSLLLGAGIQTCYDGYFPEAMRALSLQGAEVVLWPNSRGGSIRPDIISSQAFFNFVHVSAAAPFAARKRLYRSGSEAAAQVAAVDSADGEGSVVYDHGRGPVAGPCAWDNATACYAAADLDMHALRVARKHSRMFHQRRSDLAAVLAKNWGTAQAYEEYPDDGMGAEGSAML